VEDTIILQWQDLEAVERVLTNQGNEIAALITEPYQFNGPCIIPEKGYLEGLRKLTKENNVLLIFDEIISGFRVALGGVQELENVTPDLATYGKAMANGYPISAVAGTKKILETVAYGQVFLKGTYHSNPISTSAAYATISELERKESYTHLNHVGDSIIEGVKDAIEDIGINAIVQGVGPCFTIIFTEQEKIMRTSDLRATIGVKTATMAYPHDRRAAVFAQEMINQGILFQPTWRNHLYLTHSKADAQTTIEATQNALKQTKKIN
jgi:glutamate-1-semialdehyde 2,1-aminomutase